jgi:hypothetical protein
MDDKLVEKMLNAGYLKIVGFNKYKEPLYEFTSKFFEEQGELFQYIKTAESDALASLWFKEYIDIKMDEKGAAFIYLTSKSYGWFTDEDLTDDERAVMYMVLSTGNYYEE